MLRSMVLVTALAFGACAHAAPQPSLEGVWTTSSLTPFARPASLKTLVVPEADAAAYERQRRGKPPEGAADEVGGAETDWWETDVPLARVRGQARSSWIVSPADGRVPFTAAAQAANRARQDRAKTAFAGPEVRPDGERCVGNAAPPLQSVGANEGFQILQSKTAVVILIERTNTARIVQLDRATHGPEAMRSRNGESIGRWEGATLVVDTRNFSDIAIPSAPGEDRSSLHVIERFTPVGRHELHYAFFISNPARYRTPIQGEMVFRATTSRLFEVACHEGNYALANILGGARAEEAAAETPKRDATAAARARD